MRSFIRSYDSATLVKTPATRSVFSDSETVSNPKCVFFAPAPSPGTSEVVSRRTGVMRGRKERQARIDPRDDRTSGRTAILLVGAARRASCLPVSRNEVDFGNFNMWRCHVAGQISSLMWGQVRKVGEGPARRISPMDKAKRSPFSSVLGRFSLRPIEETYFLPIRLLQI